MTTINIADIDLVFLSYDEPNCEQNWRRVQELCPRALRVHGVEGSDAAHKACAELAETDRVLIIDGDNWVSESLFSSQWHIDPEFDISRSVLSFPARNSINGLEYGNGGVKIWPRSVIFDMRTHELAQDTAGGSGLDFCWTVDYVLMPQTLSETRVNHTAQQAWRAGFREGVKMAVIDGEWVQDAEQWRSRIARINLRRLETWLQVGRDVNHGVWAILGARQGLTRVMIQGWDPRRVHDFDTLDHIWADTAEPLKDPLKAARDLGPALIDHLGVAIAAEPLSPAQSQWFKHWLHWQPRTQPKRLRS